MKGFRRRIVTLLLVCVTIVTIVRYREEILLCIAPKAVLATAVQDAIQQLEDHFSEDPMKILMESTNPDGQYTLKAQMELRRESLEDLNLDLTMQADTKQQRIDAQGRIDASSSQTELAVYMDTNCLAISIPDVLDRGRLGITYDSFLSDIRKIPLLSLFIGEDVFSQWNDSLQELRGIMKWDLQMYSIPEFHVEDLQNLVLGLLALPCDMEERTISLEEEPARCRVFTYHIEAEQMKEALGMENAANVSFYLNQNRIVQICCENDSSEEKKEYLLQFDQNLDGEKVVFQRIQSNESSSKTMIYVSSADGEGRFAKQWRNTNDGEEYQFNLEWDAANHIMDIWQKEGEGASVFLMQTDDGLIIRTEELPKLLDVFGVHHGKQLTAGTVSLRISSGAQISVPEYTNLNQWTLSEFLVLAEKIGELTGEGWNPLRAG